MGSKKQPRFEIRALDARNWQIIKHYKVKNKAGKKVWKEAGMGYFPKLEQACLFLHDKILKMGAVGKAVEIDSLVGEIRRSKKEIKKIVREVEMTNEKAC